MATHEHIPLFPLNTVLFPGQGLPLQIFEDRYKIMLADCGPIEGRFGVTLIQEGSEVGPPAQPHDIGTLTRIVKAVTLPDQRILIQTQGLWRFRIRRLDHTKPYLQGDVEALTSLRPDSPDARLALARVEAGYASYIEVVRALGGQIGDAPRVAHEPDAFSWLVAATLMISPADQQALLEIDDVCERLEREAEMLDHIVPMLRTRAERKAGGRPGNLPFSLN